MMRACPFAASTRITTELRPSAFSALVSAAKAYDPTNARLVKNMASARAAIDNAEFLDRLDSEQTAAAKTGDQAVSRLRAAAERAAAFDTPYIEWTRNRQSRAATSALISARS